MYKVILKMVERSGMIQWAYGLSIVGGALILAGGLAMSTMAYVAPMAGFRMGGMMGWMGYYGGATVPEWMSWWVLGWSLATGLVVIYAGTQMGRHPESASFWGIATIVAGALSFVGMGGFMLGALSAVAGGALALAASVGSEGHRRPY